MNKTLRTKSSNNRIGGLLMIMTLGVLMMTANSAITAQTFKNELIGTWVGVDDPKEKIEFTTFDEVAFISQGVNGKYTPVSKDEIEVDVAGRRIKFKVTVVGEVLTMTINGSSTKYKRVSANVANNNDLLGTWIGVDNPKVKIIFTAGEVAFKSLESDGTYKSLGFDGTYTRLSDNVIRIEGKDVLLAQITFEGELLKMTVAQGSTKYKRESTNAANSNANANTTAQTAPIDYQKFKEHMTLSGHSTNVNSVVFSPDGKTLASGGGIGIVKLWKVE